MSTEHKTDHTTEHKARAAKPTKSTGFGGMDAKAKEMQAEHEAAPAKVEPVVAAPPKKH